MNREIKFRAWDIKNSQMEELDGYNLYIADGEIYEIYEAGGSNYNPHMEKDKVTDKYELMQYTGFNDDSENEVEIYDGDIILGSWEESVNEFHSRTCSDIAKVYWDEVVGQWMVIEFKTTNECYPLYDYCEEVKVIGNIYQNPNILNN